MWAVPHFCQTLHQWIDQSFSLQRTHCRAGFDQHYTEPPSFFFVYVAGQATQETEGESAAASGEAPPQAKSLKCDE